MGKVAIIAHRGASAYAPENTLAAFKLAFEQGADFFELDVRQCKTGELVVMHDATVDRTTRGKGRVDRMTKAQIQALGVPTLADALKLVRPGFGCYIEIKQADPRELAACIARSSKAPWIVVQSFSRRVCADVSFAGLRVELLCASRDPGRWNAAVKFAVDNELAGVNTSVAALTRARLKQVQQAGMACCVYTVNMASDARRLALWGVDGIITNAPDVCRAALESTPSPAR